MEQNQLRAGDRCIFIEDYHPRKAGDIVEIKETKYISQWGKTHVYTTIDTLKTDSIPHSHITGVLKRIATEKECRELLVNIELTKAKLKRQVEAINGELLSYAEQANTEKEPEPTTDGVFTHMGKEYRQVNRQARDGDLISVNTDMFTQRGILRGQTYPVIFRESEGFMVSVFNNNLNLRGIESTKASIIVYEPVPVRKRDEPDEIVVQGQVYIPTTDEVQQGDLVIFDGSTDYYRVEVPWFDNSLHYQDQDGSFQKFEGKCIQKVYRKDRQQVRSYESTFLNFKRHYYQAVSRPARIGDVVRFQGSKAPFKRLRVNPQDGEVTYRDSAGYAYTDKTLLERGLWFIEEVYGLHTSNGSLEDCVISRKEVYERVNRAPQYDDIFYYPALKQYLRFVQTDDEGFTTFVTEDGIRLKRDIYLEDITQVYQERKDFKFLFRGIAYKPVSKQPKTGDLVFHPEYKECILYIDSPKGVVFEDASGDKLDLTPLDTYPLVLEKAN